MPPCQSGRTAACQQTQHLTASELLLEHNLFRGIDAMHLEHVLGDINSQRANLHMDGPPHVIRLRRSPFGTSMPGAGAVHPITSGPRSHLTSVTAYPPISDEVAASPERLGSAKSRRLAGPAHLIPSK